MRVGSLVYSTAQGLGYLAKSFYDYGIVTDVMVIHHGKHPEQSWYPSAERITDLRDSRQQAKMREFCASMDVCLFFETPFDWNLINHCKKSVLMPMFECTPERLPALPDLFLCPSRLDEKVFKEVTQFLPRGDNYVTYLPVPVEYPWKLRTKAEVFVHNSGHGGLKGRNGTKELMEALRHVQSKASFMIRSQRPLETESYINKTSGGGTISYHFGDVAYESLFSQGDVFVFCEKFNGLSLPLQEARAAGMLVMCGDRFPMNEWLPTKAHSDGNMECPLNDPEVYCNPVVSGLGCTCLSPLIPVSGYVENRVGPPYMKFQEAQFDPKVIAAKIDEAYGKDITSYSKGGREWADKMTWDVLGPQYKKVLEEVTR